MSVEVRVIEVDRNAMQFSVEAIDAGRPLLKRSFRYNTESKKHFESVINKELKTFNKPSYGGIQIVFLCNVG